MLKSALGAQKLQLEYVQVCEYNSFPNQQKKANLEIFQFDVFEKDKDPHLWERFRKIKALKRRRIYAATVNLTWDMINRENFDLASGKRLPATIALAPIVDKQVAHL
jgi:hypothetical protein